MGFPNATLAVYSTETELFAGEGAVCMYYKGAFEEVLMSNLFHSLRFEDQNFSRAMKRLFAVCVEVAQNISRNSIEKSVVRNSIFNNIGIGTILILEKNDRFSIVSTNKVLNDDGKILNQYIKHISSMDTQGLREMKRELLSRPLETSQRSGKIGLIQIALKSDFPIYASFVEVDKQFGYFTLGADIRKD